MCYNVGYFLVNGTGLTLIGEPDTKLKECDRVEVMLFMDAGLKLRRITFFVLILCIFILFSCSKKKVEEDPVIKLQKILTFETVHNKVLQNSEEIKKYLYHDESDDIIVKADIIEINEEDNYKMEFQVLYDTKNIQFNFTTDEHLVPFKLKCLTTDELVDDSLLWKPKEDGAGILLSFDDHYYKIWESYFYLFDFYGACATFFVTGRPTDFSVEAIERGHDIGYHSLNHKMLIYASNDDFKTETTYHVDNFRKAGVPLLSFAYPYGRYHEWMNDELLMTYQITRGFTDKFNAYPRTEIKGNFIFSKSIDYYYYNNDYDFVKSINMMLRAVKFTEQDMVLPLSSHAIKNNAEWGISPVRLEYLLKTARDFKMNFYRFSDFAE